MPDYTVGIGGSTTMMIRDTGGFVEFWIQTGSSTWNNDQQYSYSANGSYSGGQKFRLLRGGAWQFVNSVWVGYDQDISWTIYGAGLGYPTYTQYQHIQRSTVPQPPTFRSVVPLSATTIGTWFTDNSDGGSAIVARQIGYGSSSNGPTSTISSDGTTDISGFTSGQKVYVWARVQNALGWSDWSNRLDTTTWQVPAAPTTPTFTNVSQKAVSVSYPFTMRPTDPPTLEKQFRYGKDITGVVIVGTVTIDETTENLSGLDAGGTYYFWARARNSVGWGPWSASTKLMLIAGSRVLDGGTWKRAVPYVRVGGVWKVAEPWVRDVGAWKKTAI